MIKKFLRVVKLMTEPKVIHALISIRYSGYLKENGWFESLKCSIPIGEKGEPLPWVVYPFIDFIGPKLKPEFKLFEYGSGSSTLFYAHYVKNVVAVEHDKKWYDRMIGKLPTNTKLLYKKLERGGGYCKTSEQLGEVYDIVIVDGRDRVNCLRHATNALKQNGVIVLDDSEREEYLEGVTFIKNKGFKQLDFWGMAPGLTYKKCTSLFYKSNNCLDI
jgi:hypothetical protein